MSNPLGWLWREFNEWLAQLKRWLNEVVDPSSQRSSAHTIATNMPSSCTDSSCTHQGGTATGRLNGRVSFLGTELPTTEPLERLLDEAWSYLQAQENLISNQTQALTALQLKIETNQRWLQFHEGKSHPRQPPTPYEYRFDRNRQRCYRQELAIYQQLYTLRQQKIESLKSNRVAVSMMLDNLRSELIKIDSYYMSVDYRFGSPNQNTVYTEADIQALVCEFTQQFNAAKTRECHTTANFNQQLAQLTETWRTVRSA